MRLHLRRLVFASTAISLGLFCVLLYTNRSLWKSQVPGRIGKQKLETVYLSNLPDIKVVGSSSQNIKHMYWNVYSGVLRNNSGQRLSWIEEAKANEKNDLAIGKAFAKAKRTMVESSKKSFNLNTVKSDETPLNRNVPDSRPVGCSRLIYPKDLPTTSIVIPFHNEWPSVILRTVYSLINRTPKHLLKEIILVDDASDISILREQFSNYIDWNFPSDLVKLVRLPERMGLIQARLEGLKHVTGEAVSFFDSHMEVNVQWLEPLLHEIVKNKQTLAMGQLDYIHHESLEYTFYNGYRTRYGFRWDMQFFETYFRPDQLEGKKETDPLPGVLMVGPGFVVDLKYFKHIGTYDSGMRIWGGENIELPWRVWMCGGQLLHVPCSRIGHIERSQPYSFPDGRLNTEMFNYKRAVDVWLGEYKEYVYNNYPDMADLDSEGISERTMIRARLGCKSFQWFIRNVWPELLPYKENATHWGQVQAASSTACLDNDDYVFQPPKPLTVKPCTGTLNTQGFSLLTDGQFKTTIHCVVPKTEGEDIVPVIQNCFLDKPQKWEYTKDEQLSINGGTLCLQVMSEGILIFLPCDPATRAQKWIFNNKGLLKDHSTEKRIDGA